MSVPGMEGNEFGTYHCKRCGLRLTYGTMCLDCKRAAKGKPPYTMKQRDNAEFFSAISGLLLIFIVFPAVVMGLFLLLIALGG